MPIEEAQKMFAILLAVGGVIWMIGLWCSLQIGQFRYHAWQDHRNFQGPGGELPSEMPPEQFFPRLKKLLRFQAGNVSTIKFAIDEESDNSITYERLGPLACNLPTGVMFRRIKIQITEQLGKQVIRYELHQGPALEVFRKIALAICLFLGIPVIVLIATVIWFFCVNAQMPVLRYQVYQMLQIVHVLWPPFLLIGLASQMRKGSKLFIENVIEHAADPNVTDAELYVSFLSGIPAFSRGAIARVSPTQPSVESD